LEISRDATGNRVLAAPSAMHREHLGRPVSAAPLGASGKFPPVVVEMIAVAEQANNLENVLLSVADSMERRTWRRLDLTSADRAHSAASASWSHPHAGDRPAGASDQDEWNGVSWVNWGKPARNFSVSLGELRKVCRLSVLRR